MKTPLELSQELRQIVATTCYTPGAWRDEPVTAAEYATIYAEAATLLLAEREEAIAREHGPQNEEAE